MSAALIPPFLSPSPLTSAALIPPFFSPSPLTIENASIAIISSCAGSRLEASVDAAKSEKASGSGCETAPWKAANRWSKRCATLLKGSGGSLSRPGGGAVQRLVERYNGPGADLRGEPNLHYI